MKTVNGDGWFVYFRLCGPEQAFFDKAFKLADFEQIERDIMNNALALATPAASAKDR